MQSGMHAYKGILIVGTSVVVEVQTKISLPCINTLYWWNTKQLWDEHSSSNSTYHV